MPFAYVTESLHSCCRCHHQICRRRYIYPRLRYTAVSPTGDLLVGESWSGALTGNVQRTYDAGYRTASISVNNTPITYQYDADSAPTRAGALTLGYQPTSGLLANTTLGNVNDSFGYNTFGELQSYCAKGGATPLFQTDYARDNLGRITTLTETVESTTNLYVYSYDGAGPLRRAIMTRWWGGGRRRIRLGLKAGIPIYMFMLRMVPYKTCEEVCRSLWPKDGSLPPNER